MKYNIKNIKYLWRLIWWLYNKISYNKLGFNSYIHSPLKITPHTIVCGKNVHIFKNCRIEGVKQYNKFQFKPLIIFNDNVSIEQNLHLTCSNSIIIGKNTAIAANVTITDIIHPYENIHIPIEKQDIEVTEVLIGSDCKIYNNVIILPSCHIGNHVVIGANSVVTQNIPDYSLVVGSPAIIKKRYNFKKNQWERTFPDGTFNI